MQLQLLWILLFALAEPGRGQTAPSACPNAAKNPPPKGLVCGTAGEVRRPVVISTTRKTMKTCVSSCLDSTQCLSFSFGPNLQCSLYRSSIADSSFKGNPSSKKKFWNRRCWEKKCAPICTPVTSPGPNVEILQNGNFDTTYDNSGNDPPWTIKGSAAYFMNISSEAHTEPTYGLVLADRSHLEGSFIQTTNSLVPNARYNVSFYYQSHVLYAQTNAPGVEHRCTMSVTWGGNTISTLYFNTENGTSTETPDGREVYLLVENNFVENKAGTTSDLVMSYSCPAEYIALANFYFDTVSITGPNSTITTTSCSTPGVTLKTPAPL